MALDEIRDDTHWDPCLLTTGCVHRHGHGGVCLPVHEIQMVPAAVYAYAIRAGLDMLAEVQRSRS
jgi:hypothetical protein